MSAERVAMEADLPAKFLEAILTDLRHAGIIQTQRGAQGGCRLARAADHITVADIITAVEGPVGLVRGESPDRLTYPSGHDAIRQLWAAAQHSIARVFGAVTLAQLADDRLSAPVAKLASEGWATDRNS